MLFCKDGLLISQSLGLEGKAPSESTPVFFFFFQQAHLKETNEYLKKTLDCALPSGSFPVHTRKLEDLTSIMSLKYCPGLGGCNLGVEYLFTYQADGCRFDPQQCTNRNKQPERTHK